MGGSVVGVGGVVVDVWLPRLAHRKVLGSGILPEAM